jgi:hypothetical protein
MRTGRAASTALYPEVQREVETRTQLTRPPSRHRPPQQSLLLSPMKGRGGASGAGTTASTSDTFDEIFNSDTDEEDLFGSR